MQTLWHTEEYSGEFIQFSFTLCYEQVRVHQDNHEEYHTFLRPAQLNWLCTSMTKSVVWGLAEEESPQQRMFPQEQVAIFTGNDNMTSGVVGELRYVVYKHLLGQVFVAAAVSIIRILSDVHVPVTNSKSQICV